jgi:hypothetical protein
MRLAQEQSHPNAAFQPSHKAPETALFHPATALFLLKFAPFRTLSSENFREIRLTI